MRPIKFRAWDKEDEVMIDWFWLSSEGDLYETPVTVYDTPHLELERNDDLIVMQYTGLKDKNGVEIYEGDLINMHYRNLSVEKGEVVSVEMGMTYDSDGNANEKVYGWLAGKSSLVDVAPYAEILGNVYENKGLLT